MVTFDMLTDDELAALRRCEGVGRNMREARIGALVDALLAARREARTLHTTLTDVQARCTELLLETRALHGGVVLEGWRCPAPCGAFNGAAKEWLTHCRSCGAPRPT